MNRIPKDKTQKTKYKVGTGDQSRAAGSELLVVNLFSETCASSWQRSLIGSQRLFFVKD